MTGRFKYSSYEITSDPEFLNIKFGITPELFKQFETLHHKALKGGNKIIDRLIQLIEKYSNVPHLKNYLSIAYKNSGSMEKAIEVNHWLLKEHPDYLFGKLNLAFEHYNRQEYDMIPKVVGSLMEIQDLYPERDCFHVSEVTSFNKLAILYFCAVGNLQAAESRYKHLLELAPEHPDTKDILPYLVKARLQDSIKKIEEINSRITVKTNTINRIIPREAKPEFINREIDWLYENDLRIEKEKLEIILSLPYDNLLNDLKLILKDAIYRYEYFKNQADSSDIWDMKLTSFPIHAIYLLAELRADEALDDILEIFIQGEDFLEFWFGDFMTNGFWEPLYFLSQNKLETLKNFVLTPNIWTYARTEISCCVSQIGLHQPGKRIDVIEWYREVFMHLANSSLNDGIIDNSFIGLAISDVMDLRGKELMPEIRRLFKLGYVGSYACGTLDTVEKEISEQVENFVKRTLLNIFDRYHEITTTWFCYTDKDRIAAPAIEERKTQRKTGRNDPCPCGSGKKYKNCCMKSSN